MVTDYTRPAIDSPVFRDAAGQVIHYGNRWDGSPPEDTYSVDTHPERFAPLQTVVTALIEFLIATYNVEVVEESHVVGDLLHAPADVVRAVRLTPSDPASAPLTFVLTGYPGVYLHAGLLHDFHYPSCGCDACDETWQGMADELEQDVLAVVAGGYRERVGAGSRPWLEYEMKYLGGSHSGRGEREAIPAKRLKAARTALDDLPRGWAAWPLAPSSKS